MHPSTGFFFWVAVESVCHGHSCSGCCRKSFRVGGAEWRDDGVILNAKAQKNCTTVLASWFLNILQYIRWQTYSNWIIYSVTEWRFISKTKCIWFFLIAVAVLKYNKSLKLNGITETEHLFWQQVTDGRHSRLHYVMLCLFTFAP